MDYTLAPILAAALLGTLLTIVGLVLEVGSLVKRRNVPTAKTALGIRAAGLLIWGLMALLSSGADGWTPLMMSIIGGFICVASAVVAFGFDIVLLQKRTRR